MNVHQATITAGEHARLDSYMLGIAGEARGTPIADSAGNYRFGSNKSALCVFANGQFHDFAGGAREHGYSALQLIEHLYPNEDAVAWARVWLERHPGDGAFISKDSKPPDDFAEVEAMAYIESLYKGAAPIDGMPGCTYITETRGLPLRLEDQAQLRWIPDYRGDEGALLAPVTDDAGKLVKLMVIHVTRDGCKSPYAPCRSTIRGAKRPGLYRLGSPGPKAVETEGIEKGLAARAADADYVVVTGSVSNLGKVPLPTVVRAVVIARDDDPTGSPADIALWKGVVMRLAQGLKAVVTERPCVIAPKDAPALKDLDDLYRYDSELVPILLNGANLEHGRLGDAVDTAILDLMSRLDAVAVGRARKGVADLLGINLGALNDKLGQLVKERVEKREAPKAALDREPWPEPVTDLAGVLDEAVSQMKKYVIAPDTHFDTVALWCAHAHLLPRAELDIDITPRLGFQSPEPDSGKTTFMKLARELVPRPQSTGSITSSALFRAVDARKCTLLVDEGDLVFREDANPDLLAIFNSGNERTFAHATRSVPLGDGEFEDRNFSTFAAMVFTSINKLATKSMQSRCISLPMKPATKQEAVTLLRFRASRCPELKVCGRKFARWAADLPELPEVGVPEEFVNRIADNWRSLIQIAHLADGKWPARALAAAKADAAGDGEEQEERGAGGLLGAIWRVFAAEATDPRQMHTSDLLTKLLDLDEGRWHVANKGKSIDAYYLRSHLKGYVQLDAKGPEGEARPRQWRASGTASTKWGYHELHFEDAFLRYLEKVLPSKASKKQKEEAKATASGHSSSPVSPFSSEPSATEGVSLDSSQTYTVADAVAVADGPSATGDKTAASSSVADGPSATATESATDQTTDKSDKTASGSDGADKRGTHGEKDKKEESVVTPFPRGPVGRKARKG